MKDFVVFSAFDGISCGKLALERVGFKDFTYIASEIDKNAIKCSEYNHGDSIIRVGDVTKVSYKDGILTTENGVFNIGKVDLFIGGSPCQSFSTAAAMSNNQTGLDGKSKLFYEYLRLLNEFRAYNPDIKFLLENVKMKNESKKQLDEYLGVTGKYFNSELVSFQKRSRYYWTNWDWDLPEDRNISFQDYKEKDGKFKVLNKEMKSYQRMWNNGDGKNSLSSCANITNADKVYCLTTKQDRCPNSGLIAHGDFCRYLSQNELEMAQTVPVGYTECLSYNQAAAVLGNGWTVNAIAHIFDSLKKEILLASFDKPVSVVDKAEVKFKKEQLSLF